MIRGGLLALILLLSFVAHSQRTEQNLIHTDIQSYFVGDWSGDLRFDRYHLPVAFEIDTSEGTFYNPVQNPQKVSLDSIIYRDTTLYLYIHQLTFLVHPISKNRAGGSMIEGKDTIPFDLYRNKMISPPDRPQHPDTLFDYDVKEVTFVNTDADITLAGTLTIPRNEPTVFVILLSGSGPQDRDETLMHHKPFAVLADFLTESGLGVLRYDDRGVAKSTGSHNTATSYNFAEDAAAAYRFLGSKYPDAKIGFLGHSEGGIIAQIADSLVQGAAFHIYLAGPGLDIIDLMIEQNRQVLQATMSEETLEVYLNGLRPIFEIITDDGEFDERQASLNDLAKQLYSSLSPEEAKALAPSDVFYAMSISQLLYLKWWPYFLGYQPKQYLSQIKCSILALNGSRDIQVTPDNLKAIKSFADKADVTIVELEQHNHLFQKCTNCNLREYGMLTQTLSSETLTTIKEWLSQKYFISQ